MACTVTELRTRLPEFADDAEYTDTRIQLFLNDSVDDMGSDEPRWGNKYDRAQCYLAAHYLYSATATEAGDAGVKLGPVSAKSAGGVSVTRAIVAKDRSDGDSFYSSTVYGHRFLIIRNSCFVGVLVGNCL